MMKSNQSTRTLSIILFFLFIIIINNIPLIHAWNYTLGTLIPNIQTLSTPSQLILVNPSNGAALSNSFSTNQILLQVLIPNESPQQTPLLNYTGTQLSMGWIELEALSFVKDDVLPIVPSVTLPLPSNSTIIPPAPSVISPSLSIVVPNVSLSLSVTKVESINTLSHENVRSATMNQGNSKEKFEDEHARSRLDPYRQLVTQVKEWKNKQNVLSNNKKNDRRQRFYTPLTGYYPVLGTFGGSLSPSNFQSQVSYFISQKALNSFRLDNVTSSNGVNLWKTTSVEFTETVFGLKAKQGNSSPHTIYAMTSGKLWLVSNGNLFSLITNAASTEQDSTDGTYGSASIYSDGNYQDIEITEDNDVYFLEKRKLRRLRGGVVTTLVNYGINVFSDGDVTTARLNQPSFMTSAFGMLYISDTGNNRIRAFNMTSGILTTIAGSDSGTSTTGLTDTTLGDALKYSLSQPKGIAVNRNNGVIYFVEGLSIRTLTPQCDSEKEEPMTEYPFCKCKNGLFYNGSNICVSSLLNNGTLPNIPITPSLVQNISVFGFQDYVVRQSQFKISWTVESFSISADFQNAINNSFTNYKYSFEIYSGESELLSSTQRTGRAVYFYYNRQFRFLPPIVIEAMLNTTIGDRVVFNMVIENSQALFSKNLTILEMPQITSSQITGFYPSVGVALTTPFMMNITPISTSGVFAQMAPFSYAFGFYKPFGDENYIRVTDFVTPATDTTPISKTFPLPFLGDNIAVKKDVHVVIFVRDNAGKIYPTKTTVTSQLDALVDPPPQNPTTEQLILMAHDTSQNYSSMIDKIVVTSQNYAVTLPVLYRALTASVHVSSGSLHKVTSNLATALGDTILEQQQEISQFGYVRTKTFDNSQLMLNIISQMITFNGTENVRERFTSLLSQQVISQSSSLSNGRLNPSLVLNSKNVNITLSKVIVDASIDSATIENNSSYGDISLSLKSTNGAPQTLSPRNIGLSFVSLVTTDQFLPLEASSNTLKSLSNIYDFKFYENDQLVILQNLQSPIILKFKAMENTSTSSQKQWITCKYWDEVNRNWSSNGCQFAGLESATNRMICHCSHTTKFSTFLEFNMTQINDEYGIVRSNIISLFTAQIAFGSFFVLGCLVIFIFLIIFRNQQPVKSRLVTPYLGILALFVESVLIYVTHRSLIVAKFTQPIPLEIDENSDASYFNHIATILVNTLNLTAIFSYLLQVSRIQFMQHLYRKLQFNYHHEPSNRKTSFLIRMLRIMTSKTLFFTSLFIFALINVLYWTLWVVLRRIATTSTIFNPKTYVSIVSISYSVVILFCSAVISLILCLDFIPSLMREVKFHSSLNNLESSNEASQQKTKKHNVLALKPLRPIWNMDRPLYFRMEMILYLIMFVFLMVQQGLGLYVQSAWSGEENSLQNNTFTQIQFLFEILYTLSYLLVFGGFASGMSLYYRIQKYSKKNRNSSGESIPNGSSGSNNAMNLEEENEMLTLLADERGCALFERFCVKEFSVENLYAWKYLQCCKDKLFGQDIAVITEIVLTLNDNYLQSGAEYELNVPSSLKSQFKVLRLALQEATTFESKQKELIEKVYSDLIENLQMNLGDTFSRYENTAEYLSYKEIHSLQFELNSNVKIVEE